jgi:hypothetical protein
VYGDVPPEATTKADPSLKPLQLTLVVAPSTASNSDGCVIFTVNVAEQPLASVAVTLYAPSIKPVTEAEVIPLFHRYVIVPVPPLALTTAEPFDPPKQLTSTGIEAVVTVTALGCVIVVEEEAEAQPFASYTVTV